MKNLIFLFSLMVLWMLDGTCSAHAGVRRFELESKAVGARFSIEVVLPAGAAVSGLKYPVIYCTDWYVVSDYLKSLPGIMDMGRLTEPFIFVGISQPGTMTDWATARTRDFTHARPTDTYSKQNTFADAIELAGGAARFVTFLQEELIPQIEATCSVDPARRGFMGYSLGGLIGTYILTNKPALFQYYLLGSPSLWFNEFGLALEFVKAPAENLDPIAKIYLSVGEEESWEMLKGYCILRDSLMAKGLTGPRAKMEIIPNAGHVGALPIALYNGLRFLFRGK